MHGQNPPTRRHGFGRVLLAACLPLALGALTACEDGAAGDAAGAPQRSEYVAIGDSFTATGLPTATGACRRSSQNYPHLVARDRPDVVLTDVSCGGADTGDVWEPQDVAGRPQEPQLDAVSEDTDLVTVSLGGNDFDVYVRSVYHCVQLATTDPDGDPCRTRNAGRVEARMEPIRRNLTRVLAAVAERAPEARVLLVGYPRLLPDDGACPRRVPVAAGDVAYVREMQALLVAAQERAAEEAGAGYVDVYAASAGHDVCSDEPWVNDVTDGPEGAYAFHPMPAHQRAVADLILEML